MVLLAVWLSILCNEPLESRSFYFSFYKISPSKPISFSDSTSFSENSNLLPSPLKNYMAIIFLLINFLFSFFPLTPFSTFARYFLPLTHNCFLISQKMSYRLTSFLYHRKPWIEQLPQCYTQSLIVVMTAIIAFLFKILFNIIL